MNTRTTPPPDDLTEWRGSVGAELDLETSADRLAKMMQDTGDDRAKVKLSKLVDGTAQLRWCRDYTPAEYEAAGYEGIRRQFGPGKYELVLYGTLPGTKRYVIRAKDTVDIAEILGAPVPANAPPSDGGGELARALSALAENQRLMIETLTRQPATVPQSVPDPMGQFQTFMGMLATMKGLFTTGEPAKSNISEIVTAVRELRGVADELMPARENQDTLLGMVPALLETIKTVSAGQSKPAHDALAFPTVSLPAIHNSQPVAPAAPAAPAPAPVVDGHAPITDVDPMQLIASLLGYARANAPVDGEVGELIYSQLPDDMLALLRTGPGWFDMLSAHMPDVIPHRAWFEALAAQMIKWAAEDETDAGAVPAP